MNKLITILCAVLTLCCSCAETFNVQGISSLSRLDGNKLYLKAIKDNELTSIDSCDVLHGQFSFTGTLDTVRMANLFMDEQSVLPVVLESGVINIKIDQAKQVVSGTPLNEKLYAFLDKHRQLDNRMNELNHRQSQMMLDGIDEDTIQARLSAEAEQIIKEEDRLVTDFIVNNFDNVLGPGVFMMITSAFQYPVLTPQIEDIMSKATDKFKNDPYVKDYYKTATENEAKLQGLDENNH